METSHGSSSGQVPALESQEGKAKLSTAKIQSKIAGKPKKKMVVTSGPAAGSSVCLHHLRSKRLSPQQKFGFHFISLISELLQAC